MAENLRNGGETHRRHNHASNVRIPLGYYSSIQQFYSTGDVHVCLSTGGVHVGLIPKALLFFFFILLKKNKPSDGKEKCTPRLSPS